MGIVFLDPFLEHVGPVHRMTVLPLSRGVAERTVDWCAVGDGDRKPCAIDALANSNVVVFIVDRGRKRGDGMVID